MDPGAAERGQAGDWARRSCWDSVKRWKKEAYMVEVDWARSVREVKVVKLGGEAGVEEE